MYLQPSSSQSVMPARSAGKVKGGVYSAQAPAVCNVDDISVLEKKARSLISKRDKFTAYIAVAKLDVVTVTETLASSQYLIAEFSLLG